MGSSDGKDDFEPPSGPPPLLSLQEINHLAFQGWLPVTLPPQVASDVDRLREAAGAFFNNLNAIEKRAQYPSSHGTECGYYSVPEEKEYLTLRHCLRGDSPLESVAQRVWSLSANMLHRVLCDLSRTAGLEVYIWDQLVSTSSQMPAERSSLDTVITLLRLFNYSPSIGEAAAHVDIGLLTLCIGYGKGLQLLDRSTEPFTWVDAMTPVVLVGDTLRALLRNRVRAGLHRVVGNDHGRQSIVYALRPDLRGNIDLSTFGGEGIVSMREFFYRVKGSKYNINATQRVRAQRREAMNKTAKSEHAESSTEFGTG